MNPQDPADSRTVSRSRWIIVGGGILGTTLALAGAKEGHEVVLLDEGNQLGGLTQTTNLSVGGQQVVVDKFYHVILESDHRLLAMLDSVGLKDTIRWTSAPASVIRQGREYPASSLVELATLPMLKTVDRARIGASIAASLALPMPLADRVTAVTWLSKTAGSSALNAFWIPILRAKLGTQADRVSASFMVSTFRRLVQARLRGAGDRFGVLPGGYKPVFDRLQQAFVEHGGVVRSGCRATKVQTRGANGGQAVEVTLDSGEVLAADRVILTTPGPVTQRLVPELTAAEGASLTEAPYLGVVCGAFLLEEAPNHSYITYLIDDVGLTGVIGMHALIPPEQTSGAALVYLPHYCATDDSWFDESDEVLKQRYESALQACFPGKVIAIRASSISRARYVVPLPIPNAGRPLGFTTSVPGVSVVSTAQNTTGTLNVEGSLALAETALAEILGSERDKKRVAPRQRRIGRR